MNKIVRTLTLTAIAIGCAACGTVSDAPEAGSEKFLPISNNAYLVRQGPMVDRYWIDGGPAIPPPPSRTRTYGRHETYYK